MASFYDALYTGLGYIINIIQYIIYVYGENAKTGDEYGYETRIHRDHKTVFFFYTKFHVQFTKYKHKKSVRVRNAIRVVASYFFRNDAVCGFPV